MSLTLRLEDELDVSRGELICHPDEAPEVARELEADVCWMHADRCDPAGATCSSTPRREVMAIVDGIENLLDVHTLQRIDAPTELALNDIGRVRLRTSAPLAFDAYSQQPPHRQLHPDRRGQQRHRRRRDDRPAGPGLRPGMQRPADPPPLSD